MDAIIIHFIRYLLFFIASMMLFPLYLEFLVMIGIELYKPTPTGVKKAKTQAPSDRGEWCGSKQ